MNTSIDYDPVERQSLQGKRWNGTGYETDENFDEYVRRFGLPCDYEAVKFYEALVLKAGAQK